MSVFYCIPSARAYDKSTLPQWKRMGYKIAVWRDQYDHAETASCDEVICGPYPGYAVAVNSLAQRVFRHYPDVDWICTGGDDLGPDLCIPPDEIAMQCTHHFGGTFGCMQPIGDRWEEKPGHVYAEQVCGSPWLGRDFVMRMYRGRGAFFPEYLHMFSDQELLHVARKHSALWQRPDLIHYHDHPLRKSNATAADIPAHMVKWNTEKHWRESKNLFQVRLAAGFPGSEPLEAK